MTVTVKLFLIFSIAVAMVSSAGIIETLLSWEQHEAEGKASTPQSKCLCQLSGCLCCVDLNLTASIDLGGPACINIQHQDRNVSLNLSYGDNPVHNATIKIDSAANKPTCMNLLSDLAQLCAKFTTVTRLQQGYNGCLVIQPTLMKTPQVTYNIGCFNFNEGVRQIEVSTVPDNSPPPAESESEEEEYINADELIAAVSASAEQGIALFSQWLGLNLNPNPNSTTSRALFTRQNGKIEVESNATLKNAGQMIAKDQIDKDEELFKSLLKAQDNISKESSHTGQPDGALATFMHSGPDYVVTQNSSKVSNTSFVENAMRTPVVLPPGSRRGGRAYNIQQHVNEI